MKKFKFYLRNKNDALLGTGKSARDQLQRVHERFAAENRHYDGLGYLENGAIIVFQHTYADLTLVVLHNENWDQPSFEIVEFHDSHENDLWYWPSLHESMVNRWGIMLPSKLVQYGFLVEEDCHGSI